MRILLAAGLLGCCVLNAAAAETRLRPGTWEITSKTDMGGNQVQMPKLTPDQIKQMEKAGIKMPSVSPDGGIVIRSCVTKEQSERNEMPKPKDNERYKCEQTEVKRSGNTVNWKMVCTGERPTTGSGSMTINSPESYSSSSTFTTTDPQRGAMTVNSQMQGKWISDACEAGRK